LLLKNASTDQTKPANDRVESHQVTYRDVNFSWQCG